MRLRNTFVALTLAAPLLSLVPSAPAVSGSTATTGSGAPIAVRVVRETPAGELGVRRPSGLAWSPRLGALLVVDGRRLVRVRPEGRSVGAVRLGPVPTTSTLAVRSDGRTSYLAGNDLVTYATTALGRSRPEGHRSALRLPVVDVRGAAYDARGSLVVLDGSSLVRRSRDGRLVRTALRGLAGHDLVGLTTWSGHDVLFTYDRDTRTVVGLNRSGDVVRRLDLRRARVRNPTGLAIAPSADGTDHRSTKSLYVTDAGSGRTSGRLVEVSLTADVPAAVTAVAGQVVRSIATSAFSPPSPDPSGIGYLPDRDRLVISDGEVDEMAIFRGTNLFEVSRTGVQSRNGVSQPWSDEPVGVGYDPGNRHLLVSDDDDREVYDIAAGPDGTYGSADDTVTSIDTRVAGNEDPEGVAYDPATASVWTVDGLNAQVFRFRRGPDGRFGTADDLTSNFDVALYGAQDPEGIEFDSARDTLVVIDDKSDMIYELHRNGTLLNTISTTAANMRRTAGVAVAPSSTTAGVRNYYAVARGVDNNSNPDENDGMLYEIAATLPPVGPGANQPPSVSAGTDLTVTLPASASLDGTVSDDGLPNPPGATTATWSKVSGFGDVTFGNPAAVDTTASFSAPGTYVLRLTASDSQATGADDVTVVVRAADSGAVTTVETSVASGSDDAEQGPSGGMDLASSDLELVVDGTKVQRVGLRFANLQVPRGASVSRAWIQFQTDEVSTDAASLTLRAEAADNATTYASTNSNISGRAVTTASVAWSPPAWSTAGARTAAQQTPDISTLVQAVVSRPGWTQGNALAVQLTGTGRRTAEAFEGTFAPVLHVEFGGTGTPPVNQAPAVSAGPDRTVTSPASASLDGTVSDDGLPNPPGAVTVTWSKLSGPGTVTFGNPAAVDTTASFSVAGTYVLRLSGTDSALTTTDDVTVTVNPSSPTNAAPTVNAGLDQAVTIPASASLDGTVSDDGLPNPPGATTVTWSKVSGPGTVTFGNPAAVDTTATFSTDGSYVLQLSATDSVLTTTDQVTVTVSPAGGVVVTTTEVSVASSADDAEQGPTGSVDLSSSDLELVTDGSKVQRVGLRFAGLQVPAGATVVRAWIQFQTDEVGSDAASLTLRAEAADNAATYVRTSGNLNRPLTSASVAWSPPAWTTVGARGAAQQTPDIRALVQEVVSRAGWARGNALAVQLTGTGRRTAEAFDGTSAPLLHVEWQP